MSMSKTTRERMATMVQKRQEEAEQRRMERDKQRQLSSDADPADGKYKYACAVLSTLSEAISNFAHSL